MTAPPASGAGQGCGEAGKPLRQKQIEALFPTGLTAAPDPAKLAAVAAKIVQAQSRLSALVGTVPDVPAIIEMMRIRALLGHALQALSEEGK